MWADVTIIINKQGLIFLAGGGGEKALIFIAGRDYVLSPLLVRLRVKHMHFMR